MPIDKENFFVKSQIEISIHHIEKLLHTGVFSAPILSDFQEPVFLSIVIKLDDLLQKLSQLGERVDFNDDIASGDVTDLANKIRNAMNHPTSGEHILDKQAQVKATFCVAMGKGTMMEINGKKIGSDYDDDVAIFFGEHRMYLKRHLVRALNEAKQKHQNLYSTPDPHVSNSAPK